MQKVDDHNSVLKNIIAEQNDLADRITNVELRSSINLFFLLFLTISIFLMYLTGLIKFKLTT